MDVLSYLGTLVLLMGVCFVQNMAFTAVSRSRNGADFLYHRKVAWASNGVWLFAQLIIWKHLWTAFTANTFIGYLQLVPMVIIYIIFTTEGSVFMMKRLLKTEKGARRVGARAS